MAFTVRHGFAKDERARVAELYWGAFGGKLGRVMGPAPRALAFLCDALDPRYALCARDGGVIVGVAGFRDTDGGLLVGTLGQFARHYGWLGTAWRIPLLMLMEKTLQPDTLAMDGIFVAPETRGQGVGSALLEAIKAEALRRGLPKVRLDVTDANPRARALYLRSGFARLRQRRLVGVGWIYGFRSAEVMIYAAPPAGAAVQQNH